jgi:hypothetical protein
MIEKEVDINIGTKAHPVLVTVVRKFPQDGWKAPSPRKVKHRHTWDNTKMNSKSNGLSRDSCFPKTCKVCGLEWDGNTSGPLPACTS